MSDEKTIFERVAILETQVGFLQKQEDDRRDRDRWMIGTLLGLAAVVASLVVTFIH